MKTRALIVFFAASVGLLADTTPPAAKTPPPVAPIPPRFLEIRDKINELYPDADHLPVIWDNDHDPFRFGYSTDDDATPKDDSGGTAAAAPPPTDLDTQSLIEAGLNLVTKPKGGAGIATGGKAAGEPLPRNNAEWLKRAVDKLKIGGVFVLRGKTKIMIDNVTRNEGDQIPVTVAGKKLNLQIGSLSSLKVTFTLVGAAGSTPTTQTVRF